MIYIHYMSVCVQVKLINMRDKKITAVGAGRYHSAVCTEHEVFTFGKNLGQLGMYVLGLDRLLLLLYLAIICTYDK